MLHVKSYAGCGNESRLVMLAHFYFQVDFERLVSCIRIYFVA